ncbi:MAG: hypothetical protein A2029_06760 [Chloroflexi bacterium RBG_19FT_COMBO_47_9]|nr:MAG: hypothetical protein A2029_06760 [Chloroflexi bacterium RBG_19FT_COMBO_47_9]
MPSPIIDRDTHRGWQEAGGLDTFARARKRVDQLLGEYTIPDLKPEPVVELQNMVKHLAIDAGMEQLPTLREYH